jgi:hypothetical protein
MMARNKIVHTAEPKRPQCMSCGAPGDFEITLEVKELLLERDAGITARPYWKPDYRSGSKLQTVVCASCKSQHVAITLSASATITHAKDVP